MTFLVPCTGGVWTSMSSLASRSSRRRACQSAWFPTTNQPAFWDKCSTERLREKPTIRTNTLEMLKWPQASRECDFASALPFYFGTILAPNRPNTWRFSACASLRGNPPGGQACVRMCTSTKFSFSIFPMQCCTLFVHYIGNVCMYVGMQLQTLYLCR